MCLGARGNKELGGGGGGGSYYTMFCIHWTGLPLLKLDKLLLTYSPQY